LKDCTHPCASTVSVVLLVVLNHLFHPFIMTNYSYQPENTDKSCKASGNYLRVHFKNTRETAMAVRGMRLTKAFAYLNNVLGHKQCVPFRRFNGHVGRCAQAKQFGTTQGRWPEKSVRFVLDLLENAKSNAKARNLDEDSLVISHVQVNQAPKHRRRTYRAHGRITPYMSSPCHIQFVLEEESKPVPRSGEPVKKAVVPMKR